MSVFVAGAGEPPSLGKQLSNYVEGDIVKIIENGTPVEFYVAKHDYESSLNGAGRTLLVRKDCYGEQEWDSGNVNAWANCTLRSWLNSTYLNMLDADIRSLIGTTKYYYTPGNRNWSVTTRSDGVFLLSATELGESERWFNVEGSALPIASTLQVAHLNGNANTQWTRSPHTSGVYNAICLDFAGYVDDGVCANSRGSRPAFTLPSTAKFNPDTNIIIG